MTAIDPEHLKKVHVICETKSDKEKAKIFLEDNNCIGMKAHLYDVETNGPDLLKEFNIAVIDTGNKEFVNMIIDKYDFIGHNVRIFEIK